MNNSSSTECIYQELYERERREARRFRYNFGLLTMWDKLNEQNRSIDRFFLEIDLHRVGIYGFGYLGRRLYDTLLSIGVKVEFVVDKNREKICAGEPGLSERVTFFSLEQKIYPFVDALIVTTIYDLDEIEDYFSFRSFFPIISLEEIVRTAEDGDPSRKKTVGKSRKAAILTYFNAGDVNYGQTLQAYAVQRMMDRMGIESVFVNYNQASRYRLVFSDPEGCRETLQNQSEGQKRQLDRWVRRKDVPLKLWGKYDLFDDFVEQNLKLSAPCFYHQDVINVIRENNCTDIVCGSDQLWNPYLPGNTDDVYLANFSAFWDLNKVAFAPSLGVTEVGPERKEWFLQELKMIRRFDYISVRERQSIDFIRKYGGPSFQDREIVSLLDPVFLIEPREWLEISRPMSVEGAYILCYIVGDEEKHFDHIRKLAEIKRCRVVYLYMKEVEGISEEWDVLYDVGPREFIGLISKAEYVVADSYHAFVFSLLFHKEIYMLRRTDDNFGFYDKDGRVSHLTQLFHLGERVVDDMNDMVGMKPIDFDQVDEILLEEREKSFQFLSDALG